MPVPKNANNARVSDPAHEMAMKESAEVLQLLSTAATGLTEDEAAARLEKYGPNEVAKEKRHGWVERLYVAARNPLVILLTALAIASFVSYAEHVFCAPQTIYELIRLRSMLLLIS